MCTGFWQAFLTQSVLIDMWNQFVVTPWRYCSGNRNPCSLWCLCCNRWLCWISLIVAAILVIVFNIIWNLVLIFVIPTCETLCVIGTVLGGKPACFAFSPPPPPPENLPPVASTDGPYQGVVGQSITMSAAGSTDPEGATLSATWTLGDGTTLTGMSVTHAYANVGVFPISVVVSDGVKSATATTSANIVGIGGIPPPPPPPIE